MQVSVLGFGASEMGFRRTEQASVDRLLNEALDHGINVIDTAECYLASEEHIGQALRQRRHETYLFTKCGHAAGLPSADWTRETVVASIDRSLARLATDYVDVIHLHSCSAEVLERGDVIDALIRAKDAGKTRYIGYSGDGKDAVFALKLGVFDSLETSVNVADQEAITLTLPMAKATGVGVVAKRPIANVAWRYVTEPEDSYVVPYWQRLNVLDFPQLRLDSRLGVQTALQFTWTVDGVCTAIVGTTNRERLAENIAWAAEPALAADTFAELRERWQARAEVGWVGLE
jgi:aryl-alcohol dehydrogenase-like predicted oxidoreductase